MYFDRVEDSIKKILSIVLQAHILLLSVFVVSKKVEVGSNFFHVVLKIHVEKIGETLFHRFLVKINISKPTIVEDRLVNDFYFNENLV